MYQLITISLRILVSGGIYLFWFYQPRWLISGLRRVLPGVLFNVPDNRGVIALTFDDGPNPPVTDQVLQLLESRAARGTFFLIGSRVQEYPEYPDMLRTRGHQVCNHLFDTRPAILLSRSEFFKSLEQTERLIGQVEEPRFVRPANALFRPGVLAELARRRYKLVLGSAYASDAQRPPKAYLKWAYRRMIRAGAIVVMHDGGFHREGIVELLPVVLDECAKKKLQPVTLRELVTSEPGD